MDVQILGLLKATCPDIPITVDVVEGSSKLTDGFQGIDTCLRSSKVINPESEVLGAWSFPKASM